ncbi:MAG: folate-binding protein [Methylocella sp.]
MENKACLLADRGVIKVAGADATALLHRLVTNSVLDIRAGESRYSALLTPQGKLMFDFFLVPLPEGADAGYLIDCVRDQSAELAKRLNLHKLRAKITIEDQSEAFGVAAIYQGEALSGVDAVFYRDMRAENMGMRLIASRDLLAKIADANDSGYEAHRIAAGVPKGGVDFIYGDAFVQDANLDWLNGVDFKKGCYVGQEVVARVHYRNSARKRIVKFRFEGDAPAHGAQIVAGGAPLGQVGSTARFEGLAMVRLDRLEDARATGATVKAGEMPIDVMAPG